MAYGLKYELLCTSRFVKNAYILDLSLDGYTGSDVDRNMPGNTPIVLRKDKAAVIRGTSLEFGIREVVDFELDEFYSNNPKKIKAELYKETSLLWTGYVLPQQYEAPYISSPVNVRFTATDGLGLLKNESFTLTGRVSQLSIIIFCIDKTGLALPYSIAVHLFESNHNTSLSPLEQTYEDAIIYHGKNCYEVLENIIGKYNAEITQSGGVWNITSSADKQSARMIYTSSGVYDTEASAPAELTLGYPGAGDVYPVGNLSRALEPGAKKVTMSHDFGRKKSFLSNYDFSEYTPDSFASWTKLFSSSLSQIISEGKTVAFLSGVTSVISWRIQQQIQITNSPGESFVFEIDFAPVGSSVSNGSFSAISMTVRMVVRLTVGATNYFLSKTGWTTNAGYIEETVTAGMVSPVWNHLKIITDELPGDGDLLVSLYCYYMGTVPRPHDHYKGVFYSEPLIYFVNSNGQLYPSGIKTTAVFDDSTEPDDLGEKTIMIADAPDLLNKSILYNNITRLSDGTPTLNWNRAGEEDQYSLIVQLARMLASENRIAKQKLSGTLRGNSLTPHSIITHAYNGNRKFEIAEMRCDLYEEKFEVTLLEILPWSPEAITFTVESNTSAGGSAITGGAIIGTIGGNDAGQNIANRAFQIPDFDDLLNLDASTYKNFKPGIATGDSIINVINASDGDVGMIEIIIDGTGGYSITMGNMFSKRIGNEEIDTTAGADNFIVWRKVLDDYVYEVLGGVDLSAEAIIALDSIDTVSPVLADPSSTIPVDYTLSNSGTAEGTAVVDWKITLEDEIISAGSFRSLIVDQVTGLSGTLDLVAPVETGDYVIWMKMRTDESFTESIDLTVGYLVVVSSINAIPDIANSCRYNARCYIHNYTAEPIIITLLWQILNSVGSVITGGTAYSDISVPAGDFGLSFFIYIPDEPQEGCTLALSIENGSPDPFVSNEFASVEVTFNHVDAISDIAIGNTLNLTYEITAAAACFVNRKAWIRTSTHQRMLLGYAQGTATAGTSTLSHSVVIPNNGSYITTDDDVEVAKLAEANAANGAVDAIVSNHFDITS